MVFVAIIYYLGREWGLMTDVICIGAQTSLEDLKIRLRQEICLATDDIKVNITSRRSRFFHFLICNLDYSKTALAPQQRRQLGRQCIANLLADVLIDDWQESTLHRLFNRRFHCFQAHEREQIIRLTQEILEQYDAGPNGHFYRAARKSRARELLSAWLKEESYINLDGFLHFRLRSHWEELESVLYLAINQYLQEKEQQEFVGLLQHFLEILEPKHEVVHVVLKSAQEFSILDEQGHVIPIDNLSFEPETPLSQADHADMLLSVLLSVAPSKLVLHAGTFQSRPKTLKLLAQVFAQRVEICRICDYCSGVLANPQPET